MSTSEAGEPKQDEGFKGKFRAWRKTLRDASLGPLLVADEVVAYAEQWDSEKNNGMSYSAALEEALGDGKGVRYFRIRSAAVKAMGGMKSAKLFDHLAAVWLYNKARGEKLNEAILLCGFAYNENHSVPLTAAQVRRATRDIFGWKKTRVHTACTSCEAKDAEIQRLEEELTKFNGKGGAQATQKD